MNNSFEDAEEEKTWTERHHQPLTSNGLSLKLQGRLLRARTNGGNTKSIMKNYAPRNPKKTGRVKK